MEQAVSLLAGLQAHAVGAPVSQQQCMDLASAAEALAKPAAAAAQGKQQAQLALGLLRWAMPRITPGGQELSSLCNTATLALCFIESAQPAAQTTPQAAEMLTQRFTLMRRMLLASQFAAALSVGWQLHASLAAELAQQVKPAQPAAAQQPSLLLACRLQLLVCISELHTSLTGSGYWAAVQQAIPVIDSLATQLR